MISTFNDMILIIYNKLYCERISYALDTSSSDILMDY